jgi:hypothetical protein
VVVNIYAKFMASGGGYDLHGPPNAKAAMMLVRERLFPRQGQAHKNDDNLPGQPPPDLYDSYVRISCEGADTRT